MVHFSVLWLRRFLWVGLVAFLLLSPRADAQITRDDEEQNLMAYLEQAIAWHREIASLEVSSNSARQASFKASLQQSSTKVLDYAFDFAKGLANAVLIDSADKAAAENNSSRQEVLASAERIKQRLTQLDTDIKTVSQELQKAKRSERPALTVRRDALNDDLKFAQAQQELIQTIIKTWNTGDSSETGVLGKINSLQRTVPESQSTAKASSDAADINTSATMAAVAAVVPKPTMSSNGIIGLSTEIYQLFQTKNDLRVLAQHTKALNNTAQEQRDFMRATFQNLMLRNKQAAEANNAGQQATALEQSNTILGYFKKLSLAIVPHSQTRSWLEISTHSIEEWNDLIDQELHDNIRQLAIRIGLLAFALIIPFALSHFAKKAINNYVRDSKRQTQLRTLRRIVFLILVALVLLITFSTDFGSLATFAALITAGLAVALQNVILSWAAHFLFYGSYAIRVGDTITVSGVTGKVIKIGVVRFYLLELAGLDLGAYATGRVVSFPNSTLFQTTPFYRAVPGTSFGWKEITLVLDANSDWRLAKSKIKAVVKEIYGDHQKQIKQQQTALEHMTHLPVTLSAPQVYMKLTDLGINFVIRFAAESAQANELYKQMIKRLLEVLQSTPGLRFANSSLSAPNADSDNAGDAPPSE